MLDNVVVGKFLGKDRVLIEVFIFIHLDLMSSIYDFNWRDCEIVKLNINFFQLDEKIFSKIHRYWKDKPARFISIYIQIQLIIVS